MKRGKRQIIERANIFGEQQQPNNSQSQFSTFVQQQIPQQSKLTQSQLTTHIKNIQSSDIQKPLVYPNTNKTEDTKDNAGDNDERKKRLDMLKQKYLKKGDSTVVQGTNANSGTKVSDENDSMIKAKPEKLAIPSIKTNENVANGYYHQSLDKSNQINKQHQTENNQKALQFNFMPKQDNEQKVQEENVKMDNRRVVPPPPPSMAGRKRVPPPPINSKVNMGESKIQLNEQNNEHVPQKKGQKIKVDPISQQLPVNKKPFAKIQPAPSSYLHQLQETSSQPQENINTSLIEQLQKWLSAQAPTSSLLNPKSKGVILSDIISQFSCQQTHLMSGFIQNFLLKNRQIFSQQQQDFVIQSFDNIQLGLWSRIILAVKCGIRGLKGLQRIGIRVEENLAQVVNVMEFLNQGERDRFVGFVLRQNFQLTSLNIIDLCKLSMNTEGLGLVIMKHSFENAVDVVKILKQMKCQVTEQNCEVYFRLIGKIVSEISSSQMLQKVLQQINVIQGGYQYKKQLKLKIIQKIDTFQRNTKQSRFQIPVDGTKKNDTDNDKGNGINFMGYFNQAIKKIKSQIPEKTTDQTTDKNQVSQNVVYDHALKRYLLNGKLPDDQNGGAQEQKQGKKPPPPPPRAVKHNSKINDQKEDGKKDEGQDMTDYQEDKTVSENQIGFIADKEITDNLVKNKLPPPPPPRIGLKGIGSRKPKIQASYN